MTDEQPKPDREPRPEVDWRVTLRCPSWAVAQQLPTANASHGELFIRTANPPRAGARVELDVELPDGSTLVLGGECVHSLGPEQAQREGRPAGLAVRLDSTHAVDLALLGEMTRVVTGSSPDPRPGTPPPEQFVLAAPVSEDPPHWPLGGTVDVPPLPDDGAASPPGAAAPRAAGAPAAPIGAAAPRAASAPAAPISAAAPPAAGAPVGRIRAAAPRGAAAGPPPPASAPPAPAAPSPPAAARKAAGPAGTPAILRGAAAAVGIDFGTTYTRVAVSTPGGVHLFTDERGRAMLPSVVSYLEDGRSIVGWEARERLGTDPQNTVAAPKRLLGRTIDSPEIQGMLASAGYRSERGPRDAVLLRVGRETLAVPQLCAVIIRHACDLAEKQLGTRSTRAVLTMPVTFGPEGEDALWRAAQLAGVEVIGLMKEPVAAALAYGFEQRTNAIAAVYDFGGGTFDFSVLDFRGERFRVLANRGDVWLGGEDFDLAVAQWTADQFWRRTGIQVRQRVVEWHRLLLAAEEAKRQLTITPGAIVDVPEIVLAPAPTDLRVPITQETLRELCRDLIERSLDVCREGLEAAKLAPREVSQLVLTGGTSHMPLVQDAVSAFFEREVRLTVHPDVAVVQGAAIRASWLSRRG